MKQAILTVLVGIGSEFSGVIFTGYSAAIAIPGGLVDVFTGRRMFLWDTLFVQFLGYGI